MQAVPVTPKIQTRFPNNIKEANITEDFLLSQIFFAVTLVVYKRFIIKFSIKANRTRFVIKIKQTQRNAGPENRL